MPFNTPTYNNDQIIQNQFNTNKNQFHQGLSPFCQFDIKFHEKRNSLMLDVLYIVYTFGLTKRIDKIHVDVIANDAHHKTSCIQFILK